MSNKKYLFTTGGSGGHVYPALAIAQQFPKKNCLFFIKKNRQSHTIIKQHNYPHFCLISKNIVFLFFFELFKIIKFLKKIPSYCLVSSGGSDTIIVVLAAWLLNIPIILLEQNTIPGRANRFLKYFATHIFISFESSKKFFPTHKTTLSGNPVFESIKNNEEKPLNIPQNKYPTILVFGGSQGAHFFNNTFIQAYKTILNKGYNLILITGKNYNHSLKTMTQYSNKFFLIIKYCNNMKTLYKYANFIISRAGATSISEFIYFKKKAILIPFPHAKDNHQFFNAKEASRYCSINYITQNNFNLNDLFEKLNILKDPNLNQTNQALTIILEKIHFFSMKG